MYNIRTVSCIVLVSLHFADAVVYSCSNFMTASPPARDSGCCGYESGTGPKIIGGNVTGIDQYPWLVAIEYIKSEWSYVGCGGSLISGKFVLTAAHCIEMPNKEWVLTNVLLGVYDITTKTPVCQRAPGGGTECTEAVVIAPVEKKIVHPDFKLTDLFNDIGLIKLSTAAPYTDFIRPICLPPRDYTIDPTNPFNMYVAGWGVYLQIYNDSKSSDVKRHVEVPFVNNEVCEQRLHNNHHLRSKKLSRSQLCAGNTDKNTCIGDSGGPLMYEKDRLYDIVGIVSYGPKLCGRLNDPGVYTNVYHHLPWITNTIATEA